MLYERPFLDRPDGLMAGPGMFLYIEMRFLAIVKLVLSSTNYFSEKWVDRPQVIIAMYQITQNVFY
jgi:hypothetical protein